MRVEKSAAVKIENCWCRFRDQQMFSLLKHAICSADHSLTHEIMRKISPLEAELLNDPVFRPKIRFRFAGDEFPPYIVFKIYIKTDGKGLKYLSGKKTILPASEAAIDSCNLMGNRKFFDQILADLCEEKQSRVNDVLDVTSLQDYMKYLSKLDETTAKAGGKENRWRKLCLEEVPRQHIIYDVLTYLQKGQRSDKILRHLNSRSLVPPTQMQQVQYMNMLSHRKSQQKLEPIRRSKQARNRVAKMRRVYQHANSLNGDHEPETENNIFTQDCISHGGDTITKLAEIDFEEESWDYEGQYLFEWTKNLSYDNLTQC